MQGGITPQVPVQSMYVNMDWVASFHLCVFPDVESVCVYIVVCVRRAAMLHVTAASC